IEDFIRRFRAKATKAAQVQSRVKMLEKIERIEIPENLRKVSLQIPEPPHSGRDVLRLKNIHKSYKHHKVLENLDLEIQRGAKLVIAGVNGAGKSTLMRIIANQDNQFQGERFYGTGVKLGYFAQDHGEQLDPSKDILEELEGSARLDDIPRLRSLAGSFLFSGDDVYKKVEILSGGERNRLSLLKMLLQPFNILIMDEPTNHMDIHSKEILLKDLKDYSCTLIFVSHDRSFIQGLATEVLELTPGKHRLFQGNYEYYLWRIKQEENQGDSSSQMNHGKPNSVSITKNTSHEKPSHQAEKDSNQPLSREQEKEIKAQIRRLNRSEENLLEEIGNLESKIEKLNLDLGLEENYSHAQRAKELSDQVKDYENQLHKKTHQWDEISQELQKYL
ncbi:MAG: ATP-binding cassette domain-containing protein, partial [Spirochaetaceae bacterium]|nr:ATP-binding cassette domain-containing protein [Spirochaetaceae bacterium]